jgi:ORF6N domain-containing protein
MAKRTTQDVPARVEALIRTIRGEKVILDSDLAAIYGVETKALNRAVKRNAKRFPEDFVFQLTKDEAQSSRCQSGTSNIAPDSADLISHSAISSRGGTRYLPHAFTEHGAIMAANVLNSARAVEMSVYVMRAFVKLRSVVSEHKDLARELAEVERQLTERLGVNEAAIVEVLRRVMFLLDPPPPPPDPPRRRIGFSPKSIGRKKKSIRHN